MPANCPYTASNDFEALDSPSLRRFSAKRSSQILLQRYIKHHDLFETEIIGMNFENETKRKENIRREDTEFFVWTETSWTKFMSFISSTLVYKLWYVNLFGGTPSYSQWVLEIPGDAIQKWPAWNPNHFLDESGSYVCAIVPTCRNLRQIHALEKHIVVQLPSQATCVWKCWQLPLLSTLFNSILYDGKRNAKRLNK